MAGEPVRLYANVQIASFDTLAARGVRRNRMAMPQADLLVVDEAHVVGKSRESVLAHYKGSIIVGMTATPTRGNGRGLGEIYDDLIQVTTIASLTAEGFLCPVRYFAPSEPDLAGVKLNRDGDYQVSQLGRAMNRPELIGNITENWLRIAFGRSTVVFCVTRAHSRHVCQEFLKIGVTAEHLDGETPTSERKAILARVASGETTVLCNVFVASYGLDVPRLSCAVLARPTRSLALYFQTCGRILRPFDGKPDALVIDHSGAVKLHGFLDEPQPWSLDPDEDITDRKEKQRQDSKQPKEISCHQCGFVFSGCRSCPACGHAMIPATEKIPTHEAELQEVGPGKREPTIDEKAEFMSGLKWYAAEKGKTASWCQTMFQSKFKEFPAGDVSKAEPKPYNQNVCGWVKHQNIRWARRRAA